MQGNLSIGSAAKQTNTSTTYHPPSNRLAPPSNSTRQSYTNWHPTIPPAPVAPPNTPLVPSAIPSNMFHPSAAMTNFLNAFPPSALPPPGPPHPPMSQMDPLAAFKPFQTPGLPPPPHHQQPFQQHCHQMDMTQQQHQQQQEENLRNAAAQILNDRRWVGMESLFNTLAADPYGIERLARLNKQAAGKRDLCTCIIFF